MGKITSPLSTANWRRPQFSHDQNTHQVKMPRKRKPSISATESDVTDAAIHWRKPKQDPTTFVLDVFIHECNDPKCKEHDSLFRNAEIRSTRNANRFRSQKRDDQVSEFDKQLHAARITPRKLSMINLTIPCKHEDDNNLDGKNHPKELQEQPKQNQAAILCDPAIINIIDRDVKPASEDSTSGQADRFQELLRKLQRSSQVRQSTSMAQKKPGENRPRQDSGDSGNSVDSGVDVRSSTKTRSLNPMAKEFSVSGPKQDPVAVKAPEETSINIPLSMLKRILGSSDASKIIDAPRQHLDEIFANTLQRYGIPEMQKHHIASPPALSPLVVSPTLQSSFLQHISPPSIGSTFGLQDNAMMPRFGVPPQIPVVSLDPSATGFAPSVTQNLVSIPPPFYQPTCIQPPSGHNPQLDTYMRASEYGRQMPNVQPPVSGLGPHPETSFFQAQPSMPNQGHFFNGNKTRAFGTGINPRPARKPRVPDALGQQSYEAYIEWRKANEPGYALECKARQAKRAFRTNGPDPHLPSTGPVAQTSS
ncbi:hypothetical protein CTA2_11344 [Colletotrichum tanaceti]|nr:hypothetical protein CTA2_11344 [Colletotrichum tanaceti]